MDASEASDLVPAVRIATIASDIPRAARLTARCAPADHLRRRQQCERRRLILGYQRPYDCFGGLIPCAIRKAPAPAG
jgi:hypothetical protein